jgi:all-trans-retinol 13,14-reductase
MNQHKHTVIIGSGMSGLTAALVLSRRGERVTVLEKGAQAGGCLQTFTRKGVKFETGMHCIGSMHEGGILRRLFDDLELTDAVPLRCLDAGGYDIISVGGERYSIPSGEEAFTDAMLAHFPKEREGLRRYWATVNRAARTSPISVYLEKGIFTPVPEEFLTGAASDFIESTISSARLRTILSGNAPLYAGVRGRTNVYTHSAVRSLFNKNSCRIVGGSDRIAESLVRNIKKYGGEIRTNSEAVRIEIRNGLAEIIYLRNGESIPATHVISTVHPSRTLEMLDSPLVRKSYRERISNLPNTVSNFTLYLKFKPRTQAWINANFFHYNDEDVWSMPLTGARERFPRQWLYMHLCSAPAQAYAEGAVVITYMDYGEVERWSGRRSGRRGADYEAFKREKAEQLLADMEKEFPGLRSSVEALYTSTPLTYRDYTGTERGSTYGILHDSSRPIESAVSSRTKIPNLYLSGQSVYVHGILGVIAGGLHSSAYI